MLIIIMTKLIHIGIIVLASFYLAHLASEPKTETTAEKKYQKIHTRQTDEVQSIALMESFHWKLKM